MLSFLLLERQKEFRKEHNGLALRSRSRVLIGASALMLGSNSAVQRSPYYNL